MGKRTNAKMHAVINKAHAYYNTTEVNLPNLDEKLI